MSASRRKGTAFESEVVSLLREFGFEYAERRALQGARDRGDIAGIPRVVFECKATKVLDLAGAVDEAEVERQNDGAELGVAVLKRRMRPASSAYAVLPLGAFADLLRKAGY